MTKQPRNCFVCKHRVSGVCVLHCKSIINGHDVCVKFAYTPAVDAYSSMYVCMMQAQVKHAG